MRQKSGPEGSAEKHVKEIRRKTRRKFSAEEKIRIVLEGLRGVIIPFLSGRITVSDAYASQFFSLQATFLVFLSRSAGTRIISADLLSSRLDLMI